MIAAIYDGCIILPVDDREQNLETVGLATKEKFGMSLVIKPFQRATAEPRH